MNSIKISISLLLFLLLTVTVLYLSVGLEQKSEQVISVIEIDGNLHLPKNSYFEYANLKDKDAYKLLTINLIRDRLQKHPYVKEAEVQYKGNGKVKVELIEKDFKALLLSEKEQFIITENIEVLPVLPNSQKLNYPVIRNIVNEDEVVPLRFAEENESIIKSFKILTTARLLNPGLYDNLSEIDLRNGNDIVIYFSSVNYPVILGRTNEIAKMVLFEKLWESIGTVKASQILNYVDLRFSKKVYLGVAGEKLEAGEIQS